jgi:predicted acetyltransferase
MSDEMRTIAASEIGAWVDQMGVGFLFQIAEGYADYVLGTVDLDRTWGSFDGERVVGTLRSFVTPLTVTGGAEVPAAALTNVTVAPTHRRQGRLTKMITADLRQSAERGEAVGILIASEYPIYGRFGYGPAIDGARYTVRTRDLRFLRSYGGSVSLTDQASLRREGPGVYERFRKAQPGSIARQDHWWDRVLRQVTVPGDEPSKDYLAIYRSPAGEVDGYVRYETKSQWEDMVPDGVLSIKELVANTPEAYGALWEYCSSVDLLTTIEAGDRPVDEALSLLLTDGRAVKRTAQFDFVWVRVLDPAAALAARTYPSAGRLVLEVVDPMGLAAGRFALEGGPEGATCARTDGPADLTMPVDTLGSVYLGGASFANLSLAGRIDEHRPGAVALADSMFRTARAAWCNTWF